MDRELINPEMNPALNPTYSQGISVGNVLYTSGQIGFDPVKKKLVDGGVQAETRQCIENIQSIVSAAGGSLSDVIKMTVFVSSEGDFSEMNKVYAEYFAGDKPPAKTAVIVHSLALGALVEMDAIALIK